MKWRGLMMMLLCRTEVGDGGKWLCADLIEDKCHIASLGSNGDFSFEERMKAKYPHCEVCEW